MLSEGNSAGNFAATVGEAGIRPKVAILVLNWNGREDTVRCLESLARLDYAPVEIIVIDNGSTDGSVEFLRARHPGVTVLANAANLGFCEGNNIGIRRAMDAGADYVMLLNNDATLAPDALARLVDAGEADPRAGILGPKTYAMGRGDTLYSAGMVYHPRMGYSASIGQGERDRGQHDRSGPREAVGGHAFLVKRAVVERLGGLDPAYFAYYEEIDFCVRARRAGFICRYVAEALAWHKGHGSNAGALRAYLLQRNQLLFVRKHGSLGNRWLFLLYFLLYRAPKLVLGHVWHRRFAELDIFLRAILWHVGLFRAANPLTAQSGRAAGG